MTMRILALSALDPSTLYTPIFAYLISTSMAGMQRHEAAWSEHASAGLDYRLCGQGDLRCRLSGFVLLRGVI